MEGKDKLKVKFNDMCSLIVWRSLLEITIQVFISTAYDQQHLLRKLYKQSMVFHDLALPIYSLQVIHFAA